MNLPIHQLSFLLISPKAFNSPPPWTYLVASTYIPPTPNECHVSNHARLIPPSVHLLPQHP